MKVPRLLVVGSVNVDMVVKSQRLPVPGETVTGGQFVMAAGGKGANQAVAAARLRAEVIFIAKVGQDAFGDQSVDAYRQEGIITDWIVRDRDHPTGVALILVDEKGENLISVASGANHALLPADVERAAEAIRGADAVVMQLEVPLETVEYTARLATAAGVPVILDPAPVPAERLKDSLLAQISFLKPNETEAERLTGIPVHDEASARLAAKNLLERDARHVIITLGGRGALWAGPHESAFVPGQSVTVLDSTAAGDAFNGALACCLARGQTLDEAVRYANHAAALSVTRLGAQPSLPTTEEVERFRESMSEK